ncbi:MAG: histidinol-phosphatase, partial [Cyclobacteriaceae bacterium]|nr:histidinol-phosphatase [Cyclobacteriaceae bacterium]
KPLHINAINLKEKIVPQKGYSVAEVIQNNVDVVLNQRDSLKLPMFPHINHPNFRYAISKKDFALLNGVRFFEVYNGHPLVNNYGDSIHESTEELWDYVNYIFLGNNKPLMYGFAVDDSHNYHLLGSEFSNAGRGWIMVNSNELTPKSLLDAMDKGNFYATTGVLVNNIVINNEMIKFDILEEENVSYSTEFVGYNKDGTWQLFYKTDHFSPLYKFVGNELFVRARIVSSKEKNNPFQAGDKEMAWLQPIQR